jgi:hypothetical protein
LRHSSLFNSGLRGTLSNAIGAFVDMRIFSIGGISTTGGPGLTGSVPASMSAWKKVEYFSIDGNNNKFVGALPPLNYIAMKECVLMVAPFAGHFSGNYFSCPFPPGVTKTCSKQQGMSRVGVTNADCKNTTALE